LVKAKLLILFVAKSIHSAEQGLLQDLLRQVRAEAGLTQVALAMRLRKPQSFVSKYETGERRLDLVELRQVCIALGISLAEFARRFESATQEPRRGR
jgi:transcriptional regulator with XRE-family HTH domain